MRNIILFILYIFNKILPYRLRALILNRKIIKDFFVKNFACEGVFKRNGKKWLLTLPNFIDNQIFILGIYEEQYIDFIKKELLKTKTRIFYDIGANIGNHSINIADAATQIIAFEPNKRVYKQLNKNISLNNIENIKVFEFGLSDKEKTAEFFENKENFGYSGVEKNFMQGVIDSGLINDVKKIQLKVGDEVIAQNNLPLPDIIKIDVEGHEIEVLQGLQKLIKKAYPMILLEWHSKFMEEKGGINKLKNLLEGYEIFVPDEVSISSSKWKKLIRRLVFGYKIRKIKPFNSEKLEEYYELLICRYKT